MRLWYTIVVGCPFCHVCVRQRQPVGIETQYAVPQSNRTLTIVSHFFLPISYDASECFHRFEGFLILNGGFAFSEAVHQNCEHVILGKHTAMERTTQFGICEPHAWTYLLRPDEGDVPLETASESLNRPSWDILGLTVCVDTSQSVHSLVSGHCHKQ
jgi:hypothetical protein